jgi:cold shock protein
VLAEAIVADAHRHGGAASTTKKATMAQGTVKWFNSEQGYGLHRGRGWSARARALQRDHRWRLPPLKEGQKVDFDVTQGEKGPKRTTSGSPADASAAAASRAPGQLRGSGHVRWCQHGAGDGLAGMALDHPDDTEWLI